MTGKNHNRSIWNLEDVELVNILVGRDGGKTTIRIIDELLLRPFNKNKLANVLNLDYKTIKYHINILHEHKYVNNMKVGNTKIYYPSDKLFKSLREYNIIKEFLKKQ